MQGVTRYQPLLVVMHWLLALMIPVALVGGALVLVKIPNTDPMKVEALRQHMGGGILLLALMLIRLVVRVRTAHPARASIVAGRTDSNSRTRDRAAGAASSRVGHVGDGTQWPVRHPGAALSAGGGWRHRARHVRVGRHAVR